MNLKNLWSSIKKIKLKNNKNNLHRVVLLFGLVSFSCVYGLELSFKRLLGLAKKQNRNVLLQKKANTLNRIKGVDYFREYAPKFNFSYSGFLRSELDTDDNDNFTAKLEVNQLLFDWRKRKNTLDLFALDNRLESKKIHDGELEYFLEVQSAFLELLVSLEGIRIQEAFLDLTEKQAEISALELKLGETRDVDYLEVSSRVIEAKAGLLENRIEKKQLTDKLRSLLKFKRGVEITISERLKDNFELLSPEIDQEKYFQIFKRNNVDLVESTIEIAKKKKEYNDLKNSYLPELTLSSFASLSDEIFFPRQYNFGFSLLMTMQFGNSQVNNRASLESEENRRRKILGDTFEIRNDPTKKFIRDARVAGVNYQISILNKQDLEVEIENAFYSAMDQLVLSYEKIVFQHAKVNLDQKKLEIQKKKVNLGEEKRSEFLEDYVEFTRAEASYYSSIFEYINQVYRLEKELRVPFGHLNLVKVD